MKWDPYNGRSLQTLQQVKHQLFIVIKTQRKQYEIVQLFYVSNRMSASYNNND